MARPSGSPRLRQLGVEILAILDPQNFTAGMNVVQSQLDAFKKSVKNAGDTASAYAMNVIGTDLTRAGAGLKNAAMAGVDAFKKEENALFKLGTALGHWDTTQLEQYKASLQEIRTGTPHTTASLLEISNVIARTGVSAADDLKEMSMSMLQFQALTGETGTEAAERTAALSQIASEQLGSSMSDAMGKIGEAMHQAALATEVDVETINRALLRSAGMAKTANFSLGSLAAMAATAKRAGIASEAIGTQLVRVIDKFATRGNVLDRFLGQGRGYFQSLIESEGGIGEATVKAFSLLKETVGGNVKEMQKFLQAMGLTGDKSKSVITVMIDQSAKLAATNAKSNEAYLNSTKNTQSFRQRADELLGTLDSITKSVEAAKEAFKAFASTAIGESLKWILGVVRDFFEWMNKTAKEHNWFRWLVQGLTVATVAAGGFLLLAGSVLRFFSHLVLARMAISGVASGLVTMGATGTQIMPTLLAIGKLALGSITAGLKGVTVAMYGLIKAGVIFLATNPIGWIILAIAGIILAVVFFKDQLKAAFLAIGKFFYNVFGGIFEFFRQAFLGIIGFFKYVGDFIGGVFEGIANVAAHVLNGVIWTINLAIKGLNALIEGLDFLAFGAIDFRIPEISYVSPPGAAKGGIVTRPTTISVGEAEPEMVTPLDSPFAITMLKQLLGQKSQPTSFAMGNITVPVSLKFNDETLAKVIAKAPQSVLENALKARPVGGKGIG